MSAVTFQGWHLMGAVQSRIQCIPSLLGIEIIAWLSELPLLPKLKNFQTGSLSGHAEDNLKAKDCFMYILI